MTLDDLSLFLWCLAFVQAILCGIAGLLLAERKGYARWVGIFWGAGFAYLGVLVVACLPAQTAALEQRSISDRTSKRCKECFELSRYRANRCKWCGTVFEEPAGKR